MWHSKLDMIKGELSNYDEELNVGISESELCAFKSALSSQMPFVSLSEDYLSFLGVINGLEFNGYILYGVDECYLSSTSNQGVCGLIDYNSDRYVENSVILGETADIWYIYNYVSCTYMAYDYLAYSCISEFSSFDLLLDSFLGSALL